MPDRKKLAEMIALARLETGSRGKKLRSAGYFRSDYLALQLLRTVLCTTAAYCLLVGLYIVSHAEKLLEEAVEMNYRIAITDLAACYILLMAVTIILTLVFASGKLQREERKREEYIRHLECLKELM